MEIEFYNILKSGAYEKMRVTKFSFKDTRRIVVYNPFAKELWQLNGSNLHPELIRLTDYAMNLLKKDLKVRHRIKVVKSEDSLAKFEYLLNLAKNPELAEKEAKAPGKKPTKKPSKKATKKAAKKPTKKKVVKKVQKEEVKKESKKSPKKKLPRAEPSSVPQINLPTPSKKSTLGIAKGDLDDDGSPVKMVEEFQIAYYDASGGAKLLIEELEDSISEGEGHTSLVSHIQLINELVKSKSSNANARKELEKSILELTDALFPLPAAKKPVKKKATKKAKKTTKK